MVALFGPATLPKPVEMATVTDWASDAGELVSCFAKTNDYVSFRSRFDKITDPVALQEQLAPILTQEGIGFAKDILSLNHNQIDFSQINDPIDQAYMVFMATKAVNTLEKGGYKFKASFKGAPEDGIRIEKGLELIEIRAATDKVGQRLTEDMAFDQMEADPKHAGNTYLGGQTRAKLQGKGLIPIFVYLYLRHLNADLIMDSQGDRKIVGSALQDILAVAGADRITVRPNSGLKKGRDFDTYVADALGDELRKYGTGGGPVIIPQQQTLNQQPNQQQQQNQQQNTNPQQQQLNQQLGQLNQSIQQLTQQLQQNSLNQLQQPQQPNQAPAPQQTTQPPPNPPQQQAQLNQQQQNRQQPLNKKQKRKQRQQQQPKPKQPVQNIIQPLQPLSPKQWKNLTPKQRKLARQQNLHAQMMAQKNQMLSQNGIGNTPAVNLNTGLPSNDDQSLGQIQLTTLDQYDINSNEIANISAVTAYPDTKKELVKQAGPVVKGRDVKNVVKSALKNRR